VLHWGGMRSEGPAGPAGPEVSQHGSDPSSGEGATRRATKRQPTVPTTAAIDQFCAQCDDWFARVEERTALHQYLIGLRYAARVHHDARRVGSHRVGGQPAGAASCACLTRTGMRRPSIAAGSSAGTPIRTWGRVWAGCSSSTRPALPSAAGASLGPHSTTSARWGAGARRQCGGGGHQSRGRWQPACPARGQALSPGESVA
jgi:hypothetical protein